MKIRIGNIKLCYVYVDQNIPILKFMKDTSTLPGFSSLIKIEFGNSA